MKYKGDITFIFILITLFSISNGFCVPQLINYQGKLVNADGILVNQTVDMQFRIYDASSNGNCKWGEEYIIQNNTGGVTVTNGVFNIMLGNGRPINDINCPQTSLQNVFNGSDLWLEVQVGTDTAIPERQQIVSVGYALSALNAKSTSNNFGQWPNNGSYLVDTVYQASTDGLVIANVTAQNNSICGILGYTEQSITSIETEIKAQSMAQMSSADNININLSSFILPVRKGDYWKIKAYDLQGTASTCPKAVYWIPIGT